MSKEFEALERLYKCNDDDYTLGYQRRDYKLLQETLQRLEAIDNANPSEALEMLEKSKEMMVEHNGIFYGFVCTKVYGVCKQSLLKAQEQEKVIIELCEYCGMDNLYPYDNLEEIEITFKETFDNYQRQRIESLGRLNRQEKENAELKRVLEIIKKKQFNYDRFNYAINHWQTTKEQVDAYNSGISNCFKYTEQEFDLLKRWIEK